MARAIKKAVVAELETDKDRTYVLLLKHTPIQYFLRSRHKKGAPLQFFDKELNRLRSLCYASNQTSIYQDEQTGDVLVDPIVFVNGKLIVKRDNPQLQELLSIHPSNGSIFEELRPEEKAEEQVDSIQKELEALNIVMELPTDKLESIALALFGNSVLSRKTSEVKRDVLMYAKQNPVNFIHLASDDLTELKGFAVRCHDLNVTQFKDNAFYSGDTLLCRVPFDESDKYNAFARWIRQTDEGEKFMQYANSKLK